MKRLFEVWKTLWKHLWKIKLIFLGLLFLLCFLRRNAAPDEISLTAALLRAVIYFAVSECLLMLLFIILTRKRMPYVRLLEECGPCEEALAMHRHLFPNASDSELITRADLLLCMERCAEAEAELGCVRQLPAAELSRLRYYNCWLLLYTFTGRVAEGMSYFDSCRADALRICEGSGKMLAVHYYDTAAVLLALSGDVNGSESYCRMAEQEVIRRKNDQSIRWLPPITRCERLYALGFSDEAAALEEQTRRELTAAASIKPAWLRAELLRLLDRAKSYQPANPP